MSENLVAKVQEESVLDISIDRVQRIDAPLLVIGLGGTGVSIVNYVKRFFAQRFELPKDDEGRQIPIPRYTAYLGIDTDTSSKGQLTDQEYLDITVSGLADILDPKYRDDNLRPEERTWLHQRLTADAAGKGAGGLRQASRFMLNRNYTQVRERIKSALKSIVLVEEAVALGRVEIAICTGICGGTGSGTFLDIPQIVRHCMEETFPQKDYRVTGYIVMPDVSTHYAESETAKESHEGNGYAALKELDFWMNVEEHKTPFTARYYMSDSIKWTRAPYDACILLSGMTSSTAFADPMSVVKQLVAENLLHYMAYEKPTGDSDEPFTYMSHESNLAKLVAGLTKPQPVGHFYRAIGAYSKKVPKRRMIYYEGQLLFKEFMPLRNELGILVPNEDMLKDGKTDARLGSICGDMKSVRQAFTKDIPLPLCCKVEAEDRDEVERLRQANVKPHDRKNHPGFGNWKTTILDPGALKFGETYFEDTWKRFQNFCKKVGATPKLGPFALLRYLTHENGMLAALEKNAEALERSADSYAGQESSAYNNCANTWNEFLRPPLLSRNKAVTTYLDNMKNYYGFLREAAFRHAIAEQQAKLVKRVKEFIRDALKPMCQDLDKLDKEINTIKASDPAASDELFGLAKMQERIDEQFKHENENDRLTIQFLDKMLEMALETEENASSYNSGVTFLYEKKASGEMEAMHAVLEECFGDMNRQSLDKIMELMVGEDWEHQQSHMRSLFNDILARSAPMLAMATDSQDAYVKFSYMSVPADAEKHLAYSGGLDKVRVKESSLKDHIYCITAYDGLPMKMYNQINALKRSYNKTIANKDVAIGMHLVCTGEAKAEYTANWALLPSPMPACLSVGQIPDQIEAKRFEEARELVARAVKCGQLRIDSSVQQPVFYLSSFYADGSSVTLLPKETIKSKVDAIMNMTVDSRTGDAVTAAQKNEALMALRAQAVEKEIQPGKSPVSLANYCGLLDVDIDPWGEKADEIAASASRTETAKKNYATLSEALAALYMVKCPVLLKMLEEQVEGFAYLNEKIEQIIGTSEIWIPRQQYAETFAELWVIGEVFTGMRSVRFKNASGKPQNLIDEEILKKDLQDEETVLQTCGYLADVTAENSIRYLLEKRLEQFNKRVDDDPDSFEKEEIEALVENAKDLLERVEEELNGKQDALLRRGADVDTINKGIDVLETIKSVTAKQLKTYSKVLKGM